MVVGDVETIADAVAGGFLLAFVTGVLVFDGAGVVLVVVVGSIVVVNFLVVVGFLAVGVGS